MPAWITPLFAPVWPPATAGPASSTTAFRAGRRRFSSRATARPRMPPPTTARSHSSGATATSARLLLGHAAGQQLQIGVDHPLDHLLERRARRPAELLARLAGIADQVLDIRRMEEALVDADVIVWIEPDVREGEIDQLAHRVRLAGGDHEVVRRVLLEHQPHRLDVVPGVAPVALGIEVAERQLLLEAELDGRGRVGDLARDELQPAAFRFVVE